jgi:hypothetical protein
LALVFVKPPINGDSKTASHRNFIDRLGKVVFGPFEDGLSFSQGLAAIRRDGIWKFINRQGKETIEGPYTDLDSFSEGLASVKVGGKSRVFLTRRLFAILAVMMEEGVLLASLTCRVKT